MRLIFLGAPGAGKGTHAVRLCKQLDIVHIATGDILRQAVENKTEIGLKAKSYMDKGELVPDEVVIDIVLMRLQKEDCSKGFLLDGFPRTLKQAEELDLKLKDLILKIDSVVYFPVTEEVVIERITGRRMCPKCGANFHIKNIPPEVEGICDKCGAELYRRKDDKDIETIKNRVKVFNQQSAPLIEYYKEHDILKEIPDLNNIDKIYNAMIADLGIVE
jgi:adenylate kinase